MTLIRTMMISLVSILFLTAADHREAPALIIHSSATEHADFDVVSWSWGATNERAVRKVPGTHKTADVTLKRGVFSEHIEKWHRAGTVLPSAEVFLIEDGKETYYELKRVFVTSYSTQGSASGGAGSESITIKFDEVRM